VALSELKSNLYCKTDNGMLFKGDCLQLMQKIPDKSIDMILCDLPYGTTQCKWDTIIPFGALWQQYERIIKDNGAIVLNASQPFTTKLINSNMKLFKYNLVWDKKNSSGFLNAKKRPLLRTEDICIFYKKQSTYNPQMETRGEPRKKGGYIKGMGTENYGDFHNVESFNNTYYPTNLIEITNANRKEKQHPTQKPTELFEYLIKTYSNEQNIVLDNCAGSGTTAVACENTNRRWICMEMEEKYCEVTKNRLMIQ
jgi:site-specific DNA-methyltransferase (adenine-specific)